jgi:hypothetical protein
MATLADLRTRLARDLKDTSNATFSTTELDDLINQGIDSLGDVYPKEIVQTIGTVSSGVFTYALGDFNHIYRIDVYTSSGDYRATLPSGWGDGPNSGWEQHAGVLYLPPSWPLSDGDTLRAFGYGRYIQLAASTATTDLDTSGAAAVLVFASAEAFARLMSDRAKFQQWQAEAGNTDVTLLQLGSLVSQARGRWREEQRRLRRLRKAG